MEKENHREIALTQMRNSVQKLGSSTGVIYRSTVTMCRVNPGSVSKFNEFASVLQKYGDPTLMRFLIARSMDSEKAARMFVQWQKWRATMVPNGFIADSEVPDELEPRKIFLQGLTKDGLPLLVIQVRKHFPSKDPLQFKSN